MTVAIFVELFPVIQISSSIMIGSDVGSISNSDIPDWISGTTVLNIEKYIKDILKKRKKYVEYD